MENTGCCVYITVFIVLFILKLVGAITWSWWWIITAPLWIPVAMLLFAALVILFLVILIAPIGVLSDMCN